MPLIEKSSSNEVSASRVLIFSLSDRSIDFAVESAQEALWRPLPFDDPTIALEEFDENIGALITAIPVTGNNSKSRFVEVTSLINRSDELAVPRALYSANAGAFNYVRENSLDIVVPNNNGPHIKRKLTSWLINLSATR